MRGENNRRKLEFYVTVHKYSDTFKLLQMIDKQFQMKMFGIYN